MKVEGLALGTAAVSIGEDMTFSFMVEAKKEARCGSNGIDYVKANSKQSQDIPRISEFSFKGENRKRLYTKNIPL